MKFANRYHHILPIVSFGDMPRLFWAIAPSQGHRRHAMKLAVQQALFTLPSCELERFCPLNAKGIEALQNLGHDGNWNLRQLMTDEDYINLVRFQAKEMGCGYFLAIYDRKEIVCKWMEDTQSYVALEKQEVFVGDDEFTNRDDLYEDINSKDFLNFLNKVEPNAKEFWMYRLY